MTVRGAAALPAARSRTERGAAMIVGALMFAFLALPLCAIGVDTARWWVEAQRVQAAADAAATAGVTNMPDNFAAATARAKELAEDNGYKHGVDGATVTVAPGGKPTQLKVTVTQQVNNHFAKSFGVGTSSITRTAMADFNGPAPMGSPCNTFGNEPLGTTARGPAPSQLDKPDYAQCSPTPMFWASAAGPNVVKTQGDQFGTRYCGESESRCTGSKNDDYDPNGYFYMIRIGAGAVNQNITLQIFDPAYVSTESRCTMNSGATIPSADYWNPFTTSDAKTRYAKSPTQFCTGDNDNDSAGQRIGPAGDLPSGGLSSHYPTVTSFGLRSPVATLQPLQAPPVAGCAKQYPGYGASGSSVSYPQANSYYKPGSTTPAAYNDKLAAVFHHWVTLCSFTPTAVGDYYLQVRTNVALNTASYDGNGGYNNSAVYTAGEDLNARGTGTNRFSLRAVTSAGKSVSVSAYDRMPIFANSDSATTVFNLVRVIPAAATQTLVFSFFDVGESSTGGTMKVLPPPATEATGIPANIAGCVGVGKVNEGLTDCKISGISSGAGWDGQYQEIRVPIPNTYNCEATSPGGCWFRVEVSFPGGTVTDATTWTARIEGEPIRLIE